MDEHVIRKSGLVVNICIVLLTWSLFLCGVALAEKVRCAAVIVTIIIFIPFVCIFIFILLDIGFDQIISLLSSQKMQYICGVPHELVHATFVFHRWTSPCVLEPENIVVTGQLLYAVHRDTFVKQIYISSAVAHDQLAQYFHNLPSL